MLIYLLSVNKDSPSCYVRPTPSLCASNYPAIKLTNYQPPGLFVCLTIYLVIYATAREYNPLIHIF